MHMYLLMYMHKYNVHAGFHTGGEKGGNPPPPTESPPPPKTRYLFHANDTDQSYNLIITIMHLKCV